MTQIYSIQKTIEYSTPFAGLKILLIDDDVQLCDSLRYYFEDQECIVTVENDSQKATSIIDSQKFDLVLVDINMPKISGHEIIAYLSRNHPEIPAIVISGTGEIQNAIRAIQLGAWDFITKPVMDFEVLELSIHRALEKVHLIEENKTYKINLERLVEQRTRELEAKAVELEKTNEELNKAKQIAENSDKLKSEFLAQMSHEIRTPVNVILSYVSLLLGEHKELEQAEIDQGVEVIQKSSKRLIRTIELILNMSELEIGIYQLYNQKINLVDIAESIVLEYKTMNKNPNLDINFSSSKDSFLIHTDQHSVHQIISNVIDNAVKYTEAGSVSVNIEECSGSAKVTVNDTGVGISDKYLPIIFEPFSQEEQGYTRSYEGNGLGLSLVKKYCDLNKVKINICSKKYKGTKVELEFSQLIN